MPQIVIMVMLGKLNFVETASALSITVSMLSMLWSLRGILVNCIVAGRMCNCMMLVSDKPSALSLPGSRPGAE